MVGAALSILRGVDFYLSCEMEPGFHDVRVQGSEFSMRDLPSVSFTRNKAPKPKISSDSERIANLELEIAELKKLQDDVQNNMEYVLKKCDDCCDAWHDLETYV